MSTIVFPHILGVVNDSITQDIFLERLKLAVVTPIIKDKNGDLKNSRTID